MTSCTLLPVLSAAAAAPPAAAAAVAPADAGGVLFSRFSSSFSTPIPTSFSSSAFSFPPLLSSFPCGGVALRQLLLLLLLLLLSLSMPAFFAALTNDRFST